MEILVADDKLRDEILNDAKIKADRIIKKADKEAHEIIESSNDEIQKFENETKQSLEKYIQDEQQKIFASVDIEAKKRSLKIIGRVIDEIFDEVKKEILNNKLIDYNKFMLSLIKKSCEELDSDSYIIEIGLLEQNKIDEKEINSIKLKKGKIQDIITKNNRDGFVIFDSQMKKSVFVSINYYIENLKKTNRLKIFKLLSEGGEKL